MKTSIIAAILAVGVLLRPQLTPAGNSSQPNNKTAEIVAVNQEQGGAQPLSSVEMNTIFGGFATCYGEIDKNGTSVWVTCCLNLWIIKICVSVYLGEIPAPLKYGT